MSNSAASSLRQYRFKKDVAPKTKSDNNDSDYALAPGRKRIHVAHDSSSDEAQSQPDELSVKEKESLLSMVRAAEPDYDPLTCQDALFHSKWNTEEAIKYLKERCVKKRKVDIIRISKPLSSDVNQPTSTFVTNKTVITNSREAAIRPGVISKPVMTATSLSPNVNINKEYDASKPFKNGISSSTVLSNVTPVPQKDQQHPKKLKKRRRGSDSSNEDLDDGDNARPTDRVYDSDDDDSDEEQSTVSYVMTKDRRSVFDFMNTANPAEFLSVRGCSVKKIEIIIELRPFKNWVDLIQKMQSHKFLSADLLNACQDFLERRNKLAKIMKKCSKMVDQLEKAISIGGGLCRQPSNLNPMYKLADYQLVGLNWLAVMHNEEMNGILADEMGLGKTIQVIAFLAYLKDAELVKGTHLIVVPSSTLENWVQEFGRWCPSMIVEKYYGAQDERRLLRIKYARGGLAGIDVLLTTYHTVGSPEERKMFRVTKMQYVIFDEAHMLKNMTSQRYTNLFRINAERRLLLTGTPLQNNLLELMSLLCFVMPSMFAGSAEDIKSLFQKNKQIKNEEEVSSFDQKQIEEAKRIMKPFLLRRLKEDVLNSLPPKLDNTLKVPLTRRQYTIYNELVQNHSSETGIVRASNEQSGISIMMDMRKLANHPLLLRYHYTDADVHEMAKHLSKHPLYKKNSNPQYIFEELAILSDFQLYQTLERYHIKGMNIPDHLILDSGKFVQLDKLLPRLKNEGHRVLIFSQFTMMLDILERYLDIREYGFLRLDGQTTVTDRQDLIDQYMSDPELFVFLLSTRAGGLGINLTAADTVIIHDIDFNPYNDKQAEDRCHRMGQNKTVTVYRLIGEGTIEEGMRVVAQGKLNLEKEVTNDNDVDAKEHKCMIRILTMALGIHDEARTEKMLSPSPKKSVRSSSCNEDGDSD